MMCVALPAPASYSPVEAIKAHMQAAGRLCKSRLRVIKIGVCGDAYQDTGETAEDPNQPVHRLQLSHTHTIQNAEPDPEPLLW